MGTANVCSMTLAARAAPEPASCDSPTAFTAFTLRNPSPGTGTARSRGMESMTTSPVLGRIEIRMMVSVRYGPSCPVPPCPRIRKLRRSSFASDDFFMPVSQDSMERKKGRCTEAPVSSDCAELSFQESTLRAAKQIPKIKKMIRQRRVRLRREGAALGGSGAGGLGVTIEVIQIIRNLGCCVNRFFVLHFGQFA